MRAPLHGIRPGLLVLFLISFGVGSRAISKPNALEILVVGSLGNVADPGVWRNYGFGGREPTKQVLSSERSDRLSVSTVSADRTLPAEVGRASAGKK
jgi:hypothetical protein